MRREFAAILVLLGLGAAVAGLLVIDTPGVAREKRLDARRESDLVSIESAIERFYRLNGKLPGRLDETDLGDVPADPETDAPYRYEILEEGYRLCATFGHAGEKSDGAIRFLGRNFDRHGAGTQCFDRPLPGLAEP